MSLYFSFASNTNTSSYYIDVHLINHQYVAHSPGAFSVFNVLYTLERILYLLPVACMH